MHESLPSFSGSIASKFVSPTENAFKLKNHKCLSLLDHLDCRSNLETLFHGASSAFEPLDVQANKSNNVTFYDGQSIKA